MSNFWGLKHIQSYSMEFLTDQRAVGCNESVDITTKLPEQSALFLAGKSSSLKFWSR